MKRRLVAILVGLALLAGLVLLRAADPYPLQALRQIAFDTYQRVAPREGTEFPVRVIDVDEVSLARLGQWPWPRDRMALLTERLAELGAAAIAFDVLFPEPDRLSPHRIAQTFGLEGRNLLDTDAAFAEAIASAPVVLGFADAAGSGDAGLAPRAGIAVSGTDPTPAIPALRGAAMPLTRLADAAAGLGSLSLEADAADFAVHRLPLLWAEGSRIYPGLALEALRIAMGLRSLVVLGEQDAPFVQAVRVGAFTIPTTASGALWLYYRPPDPGLFISAADLLGAGYASHREQIAGHIVVVGTSASGLFDIHGTALGHNVPGAAIHAQAIEQILSGHYLTRADWVAGLEIVGFAVAGLVLVGSVLFVGPLVGLVVGMMTVAGAVALAWGAFRAWGLMVDPAFLTLGLVVLYAALVFLRFVIADADRRAIRRAFGHYVAPAVLIEIERSADRLTLGGARRDITVLFTDMRGFTRLSERYPPERILGVLNVMFGALGQRIVEQHGTIDKFVGDSIMAFWNAPLDVSDHATRACHAVLGMRATLRELNARNAFGLDGTAVAVGIGIATGDAVVGNMGLSSRFDYSAVGDVVNLASRVEGLCRTIGYDILLADAVQARAHGFATLPAGVFQIRGKDRAEPVHLLVGDGRLAHTPRFVELAQAHRAAQEALAVGDAPAELLRCRTLAAGVEPGLLAYYDAVRHRREDFVAEKP